VPTPDRVRGRLFPENALGGPIRYHAAMVRGRPPAAACSRRDLIKGASALAATLYAAPVRAAAPPTAVVTPDLVAAARQEGKVVWYTSAEVQVAEKIAKAFEAKHSGIAIRVERTGAERVYTRIAQERASRVYAVDVVNSSDAAHFIAWKRDGLLAAYLPEDVAKFYPPEHRDPDGLFATFRLYLSVIGYNTKLVKPADAPKSFADLLEPKWKGKIVKAHPSYSGGIMTATYQMARDLGWEYFEKLAKQNVMQVQSSADPPRVLARGERAVMADGADQQLFVLKDAGQPVEVVYPAEGAPLVVGPNGIVKEAPNPNAARLLQSFLFSVEAQQLINDLAYRSAHPHAKERPGRTPLRDIKTMKDDPVAVEKESDAVKARYAKIFRV
jgi:iron(III) transport system substrate-binding protein